MLAVSFQKWPYIAKILTIIASKNGWCSDMLWLFVPPAPWRLFDAYRVFKSGKIQQRSQQAGNRETLQNRCICAIWRVSKSPRTLFKPVCLTDQNALQIERLHSLQGVVLLPVRSGLVMFGILSVIERRAACFLAESRREFACAFVSDRCRNISDLHRRLIFQQICRTVKAAVFHICIYRTAVNAAEAFF